jgi:hypothetical protein
VEREKKIWWNFFDRVGPPPLKIPGSAPAMSTNFIILLFLVSCGTEFIQNSLYEKKFLATFNIFLLSFIYVLYQFLLPVDSI